MRFFLNILISVILAIATIVPKACQEITTETLHHKIQNSIVAFPNRNPPCPEGQRRHHGECRPVV